MVDEAIDMTRQIYRLAKIVRKGKAETFIDGDRDKLIRVVNNLLTNAIKYSLENAEIAVATKKDDHSVTLSVTDKGQGIAEDDLHFVFDRFFRSDKTKGLEGLGIGLYLSRRIIEAHHGRIWVESVEGKGSTFYFSLPLGK
jgi:two-component system sensor histidine kinase VicK